MESRKFKLDTILARQTWKSLEDSEFLVNEQTFIARGQGFRCFSEESGRIEYSDFQLAFVFEHLAFCFSKLKT